MKDYLKPFAEYVKFVAEEITDLIGDSQGTGDNEFSEDDFG